MYTFVCVNLSNVIFMLSVASSLYLSALRDFNLNDFYRRSVDRKYHATYGGVCEEGQRILAGKWVSPDNCLIVRTLLSRTNDCARERPR